MARHSSLFHAWLRTTCGHTIRIACEYGNRNFVWFVSEGYSLFLYNFVSGREVQKVDLPSEQNHFHFPWCISPSKTPYIFASMFAFLCHAIFFQWIRHVSWCRSVAFGRRLTFAPRNCKQSHFYFARALCVSVNLCALVADSSHRQCVWFNFVEFFFIDKPRSPRHSMARQKGQFAYWNESSLWHDLSAANIRSRMDDRTKLVFM